jgi:hypothetical protein
MVQASHKKRMNLIPLLALYIEWNIFRALARAHASTVSHCSMQLETKEICQNKPIYLF